MSPRLSFIAAALVCGAAVLHAADPAPAKSADPAPAQPADPVEPYVLKKRSEFAAADANARAPFWPIGWAKPKPGVQVQQAAPAAPPVALDEKAFRVTSILLGTGTTPSLAVINGRAYSEGEFLRMPKGGTTPPVRIRVQRITDGTVILQNANQTMVASLVRSELQNKRSEELLLDPDR